MNSISGLLAQTPWPGLLRLMIDITIKGALICSVAGTATFFLRRSSAYIRNMVWVFALAGLIILPAFSVMAPVWNLPIIPELGSWSGGSHVPDTSKLDQEMIAGRNEINNSGAGSAAGNFNGSSWAGLPWYAWGILAWIGGGILFLCWCGISQFFVRRLVRNAVPASQRWNDLLGRAAVDLGLGRRVRLLESESLKAAITVGIKNPMVVLPAESEGWTDRRRGGRRAAVVTGFLVLAIVLPLSVSGFWSVQAQEKTDKVKEKQKFEQLKDEKAKSGQLTDEQIKKEEALKKNQSGEESMKEEMSPEESAGLMWEKLMVNENSAAAKVGMATKEKGVKEGIRTFMALKEKKSDAVYFKEAEFNSLGYVFLFGRKLDEAIAIFELNVKEYPDSWNVYDSLGEAFLTAGSLEKAAKNYEMAIKLNPESEVSARMLERVRKQMNKEA